MGIASTTANKWKTKSAHVIIKAKYSFKEKKYHYQNTTEMLPNALYISMRLIGRIHLLNRHSLVTIGRFKIKRAGKSGRKGREYNNPFIRKVAKLSEGKCRVWRGQTDYSFQWQSRKSSWKIIQRMLANCQLPEGITSRTVPKIRPTSCPIKGIRERCIRRQSLWVCWCGKMTSLFLLIKFILYIFLSLSPLPPTNVDKWQDRWWREGQMH